MGVRGNVSRFGQTRRSQWSPHPPAPQKDWEVNQPAQLANVLATLERIQNEFNTVQQDGKQVSLADLIVLRLRRRRAGRRSRPRTRYRFPSPGRTDASQEQTDIEAFEVLEPPADGFRNYLQAAYTSPEEMLVDKAQLLMLTAPEMTVLVGGMRVLNANVGQGRSTGLHEAPGGPHQ